MKGPRDRTNRAALLLIWLSVTIGIASFVARHESTKFSSDAGSAATLIQTKQRATITLGQHTISPVVLGDGVVDSEGAAFDLEELIKHVDLAYKLLNAPDTVKALIIGGPIGFDCAWLGIQQAEGGGMKMRCRIPDEVSVVPGLSGRMVLSMVKPTDTMALPLTAVVGGAQLGQVIIVGEDGSTSTRQVGLGMSDSFWIEITSGLSIDEIVLLNPVQSDFAASDG